MLNIDKDIVTRINESGLKSFGNFKHIDTKRIDDILSSSIINAVHHGEILALKKHIKVSSMTNDEAEKLTSEESYDVDIDELHIKFNDLSTSQLTTLPSPTPSSTYTKTTTTLTADTVTAGDIFTTNFLKYSSLKLNDKDSILNFMIQNKHRVFNTTYL